MGRQRNSNIELLRILCILFVLIHHILYHGVSFGGVLLVVGFVYVTCILIDMLIRYGLVNPVLCIADRIIKRVCLLKK